jgi:hypothetical protein
MIETAATHQVPTEALTDVRASGGGRRHREFYT